MTEELKQAAQQALEAYDAFADADDFSTLFELTRKMNVLRDLTQRPAAQAEQWLVAAVDAAMVEMKNISPPLRRSECERLIRAAAECMPAPQQSTPEPDDDAQIRAIGEGLRSAHDHIEMHRLERSHCKDAERIREGLAAFSAYKKRGDFAATPEPVGGHDMAVMLERGAKAWAGVDPQDLRAGPTPEPLTRFCPGCGSVGDVPDSYRDCCPDGAKARLIPTSLAHHCHDLFTLALGVAKESATLDDVQRDAERYRLIKAYDEHSEDIAICRWSDTGWVGEWVVEHEPDSIIDAVIQRRKNGGAQP